MMMKSGIRPVGLVMAMERFNHTFNFLPKKFPQVQIHANTWALLLRPNASRNFALLGGYGKNAVTLSQPILTPENQPSARARVLAGSLLQAGVRILGLFCGLATMAFLTRHLQLGDYGRYALAVVLVNWLSGSLSLLMGGALVRLVAGSADGMRYAVAMRCNS